MKSVPECHVRGQERLHEALEHERRFARPGEPPSSIVLDNDSVQLLLQFTS